MTLPVIWTILILALVSFLFLRWYRGKVKEEYARDLLRVMQVPCVWDNPPETGMIHIYLGVSCGAAQTPCGAVIDPFTVGPIERGYAEGQRLCPQCSRMADSCIDIALSGVPSDVDTEED